VSEVQGGTDYGAFEFTVRTGHLAQLAKWALPAVPSSPTLPANGCFKVTVGPGRLMLAASDQRQAVFAETPAVTAQSEGEVLLPARKLEAMLGEAPDGDVTVSVKGMTALVTAGSATWSLKLFSPNGYTELPDLSGAQFAPVSREKLLAALNTVKHAVGKDDGRPSSRQVSIAEAGGVMYARAADSSQFAQCPVPGFPVPLCIPGGVLDDLLKLLKNPVDDVAVADSGSYVVFRVGVVTLAMLKMNHAFPDVDSTFLRLAAGNDMLLGVDKAELAGALRRVRINSDASTSAVALIADSTGAKPVLTVMSRDAANNGAEEVIAATWDGGHHGLVVNAAFLGAMLSAHPGPFCEFRLGKPRGKALPHLLLEDKAAGVTGICTQMVSRLVGYKEGK
jgi:DNA polymerase III sliding clamp (beta) subunit (PCNA family)